MVADRHRLAAYHNKHCWRAFRGYQQRWPWTTLNPKNMGLKWFFCYFRLRRTLRVIFRWHTGDRPRQPAYEIKLMPWRVSWALAQISCSPLRDRAKSLCKGLINRCTQLDDILHEHVSSQPPDTQRMSRSSVKGQGHMGFWCFAVCVWYCGYSRTVPMARLSCFVCTHDITHKPVHVSRWNFACTCSLTTARNTKNSKVIGQGSRSQDRIIGFFTIAISGKRLWTR